MPPFIKLPKINDIFLPIRTIRPQRTLKLRVLSLARRSLHEDYPELRYGYTPSGEMLGRTSTDFPLSSRYLQNAYNDIINKTLLKNQLESLANFDRMRMREYLGEEDPEISMNFEESIIPKPAIPVKHGHKIRLERLYKDWPSLGNAEIKYGTNLKLGPVLRYLKDSHITPLSDFDYANGVSEDIQLPITIPIKYQQVNPRDFIYTSDGIVPRFKQGFDQLTGRPLNPNIPDQKVIRNLIRSGLYHPLDLDPLELFNLREALRIVEDDGDKAAFYNAQLPYLKSLLRRHGIKPY